MNLRPSLLTPVGDLEEPDMSPLKYDPTTGILHWSDGEVFVWSLHTKSSVIFATNTLTGQTMRIEKK